MRRALTDHTGLLPQAPIVSRMPDAIGTDTVAAIQAGVDRAAVAAVRELVTATVRELEEPDCPVLITGGDAGFYLPHLPGVAAAPEPFTLTGVARVAFTA